MFTASESISLDPGVQIQSGATVTLRSPIVNIPDDLVIPLDANLEIINGACQED